MLALGFLGVILAGTGLLSLPVSGQNGAPVPFWTALFSAVSAACVTGLSLVDVQSAYSLFGESVLLALMQVGGPGFMAFATVIAVFVGKRITLRARALLRDSMGLNALSGSVRATLRFLLVVFSAELAGALLLAVRFVPLFGLRKGLYYSVFHAVSAFCNAGFDLFSQAGSLSAFRGDAYVLLVVSLMIILGGIGFAVLAEVFSGRSGRKTNLHTKVVLASTAALLAAGTLLFALIEWDNPATLGGLPAGEKVLNAFFQSVTTRTAGFYALPQEGLRDAGKLASIMLMFVGASPVSTGGGVKTSTMFLLFALVYSFARGQEDVTAFRRSVPQTVVRTALCIMLVFLTLLLAGALLLSVWNPGIPFIDVLFETASALGTVGLTSAGTARFSTASQALLMLLMYIGRVGPMTLMLVLLKRLEDKPSTIRYPSEQILVG